ncbi:MAG TPA: phasin family protein [Burkholderiales bacterium]|nr:phasin family protein [Burkholderiales bacterium]
MFSIIPRQELWASANQAYLEALSQDTDVLLAATDDLLALDIAAKKSALNDGVARANSLLDVKNAKELLALLWHLGGPGLEKSVTYGCLYYDLMARYQTQAWRLAEIRSEGLNEALAEKQTDPANSEHSGSSAGLGVARSLTALAQISLDTMRSTGRQLAAMMESNVAAMTLASVQISKSARKEVEVFLRESPP